MGGLKSDRSIRYADDFVILHEDKKYLEKLIPQVADFLETNSKIALHPKKTFIKTFASGLDFLGWVHFSYNRVPRVSTKKRMFKKLLLSERPDTLVSYLGLLSHGDTYRLIEVIRKQFIV